MTVPITGSFAANNSESLRDAVLDDLGITLLPDFTAQQGLRSEKLLKLMPNRMPVGALRRARLARFSPPRHTLSIAAYGFLMAQRLRMGSGIQRAVHEAAGTYRRML